MYYWTYKTNWVIKMCDSESGLYLACHKFAFLFDDGTVDSLIYVIAYFRFFCDLHQKLHVWETIF